ncbi:MAG: integral membrane protein [Patiriisocius sp.]|jgi:integral membrane protein
MKNWFKYISYAEAISFLVLLGVAMPLKYMFGMTEAVAIPGMIHGMLFVVYCVLLVLIGMEYKWSLKTILIGFLASILPFGPFIFHKKYVL